jgi:hypothetical protein
LAKCETYLRQGISLVVVDVVTTRRANFHEELLTSLVDNYAIDQAIDPLYAAAYHPIRLHEQSQLDIWYQTFDIGAVLPTLPLWLGADLCVPLILQETYEQTCRSQRITGN